MSASGKRRARRGARKNDGPSKAASPKQLKIAFAVFGVIVAAIVAAIALADRKPDPNRVWSSEHNHFHDANGNEL